MDNEEQTEKQVKISVFTPLLYVVVLLSTFVVFSVIYRKKKLNSLTKTQPLFGENNAMLLYVQLKEQSQNPEVPADKKPHAKVLKAALLRRGAEGVRRSLKLKELEPVINKLYQSGLIGDDIFNNFGFQASFQEFELKDILKECESFKKGWAQQFFAVSQEICFNEALRRRIKSMDEREETLAYLWQYFGDKLDDTPEEHEKNIQPTDS